MAEKKILASDFIRKLKSIANKQDGKILMKFYKTGKGEYGEGDKFMGVRMGTVYKLSKDYTGMSPSEIEKMLKNPFHEIRGAGLSIMSRIARLKRTPESMRKILYEIFMRQIKNINNWDLVDLSCMYVVGGYLIDKKRDVLYKLALSENLWERRIAIVSSGHFIRQGDLKDTFKLSKLLLYDKHDLIHKATGWMLRYAGDRNIKPLFEFLDKHAATMPRTALRYAIEHFEENKRKHYMNLKNKN